MTTFAVTVTYGNRYHLVKQVIDSALAEGVAKVIVVDNNSVPQSREQLKAYELELGRDKIKVLYLDDNYGSAGGFKRGLEEAYNDQQCEFIWLLDDDNVPFENALLKLQLAYEYLGEDKNNVLISFRESIMDNMLALFKGKPIGYKTNSFLNFHIKNWVLDKINNSSNKNNNSNNSNFPILKNQVAPYGGLFLAKDVIAKIGFPNEAFFVYADDHEWTLRMTNSGFNLYLCSESKLKDIDWTWTTTKAKNPHYEPTASEFKIYYGMRNHVFLDKNFIENKYVYFVNMSINLLYNYLIHIFLVPKIATKRFKLILRAVRDGLNGKLGRTF
ncbi:glycosyltransferase [Deferribacterales bacterium Es71-Z0220]|uniref:glycosyltransferase n=1 Tax=Deferrivibrio essentukiensis TaxID=2880922 RepID=UPI001F625D92|nr:glycosyltransferase [Deferrivibrio essentukiensis]MCB4205438.1 glycosyltransferase [Deferrivibrio essentukiensis]